MTTARIAPSGVAAERGALTRLGVGDQAGVLLGEDVAVLADAAIACDEVAGQAVKHDELRDRLLLAELGRRRTASRGRRPLDPG